MTEKTPIEEATDYLEARRSHYAILRQEDTGPIDTIWGKSLTARTVQLLLEQIKYDAERIANAAAPTAWWFDTGEFDYDAPKLYATEQLARDAAITHWRHFNPFPHDVEFAWLQEPDDDPDEPDPNRGFELVAQGRKTGHTVRSLTVQGAPQPNPIAAADLLRYPVGNDGVGRLALWCNGCEVIGGINDAGEHIDDAPIWNEDDAAEQVTELTLANLVAIAEQHEQQHHAEDIEPRHFSPGTDSATPDHPGSSADCPTPECQLAEARHRAAADMQDITAELFAERQTPDAEP